VPPLHKSATPYTTLSAGMSCKAHTTLHSLVWPTDALVQPQGNSSSALTGRCSTWLHS